MSLLSRILGQKTLRGWEFDAHSGALIWKLLISPDGILAGEERHPDNKTGSLFAVNVSDGKPLWRDVTVDEAWWFTTELATKDTLYVHKFAKPDMPIPKGIIALDIRTGALRWEQPDVAMLFEQDGLLYTQREGFGGKEFFSIDPISGQIVEGFGSNQTELLSRRTPHETADEHSVYALPVLPEDELFTKIAGLLQDTDIAGDLRGSIDFAEYGPYIIFSYHERRTDSPEAALGNILRNTLRILDVSSGEIVHSETLNKETPFPVPDNFFIHRGVVIYVKERSRIVGIPLG